MHLKFWLETILLLTVFSHTWAKPSSKAKLIGMDIQEFINTLGLGSALFEETRQAISNLKQAAAQGINIEFGDITKDKTVSGHPHIVDGVILDLDLAQQLLPGTPSTRRKRSFLVDFNSNRNRRWSMTELKYAMCDVDDGEDFIEDAIKEFERKTCFTFKEVDLDEGPDIVFLNVKGFGCASYLGRVNSVAPIFLEEPLCTREVGTVLRHIGQTVGLIPEMFRPDADNLFEVSDLIPLGSPGYSLPSSFATDLGTPFDYGSVLQFSVDYQSYVSQRPGLEVPGLFTIRPRTPPGNNEFPSDLNILRWGIGQEQELSFWDARAINYAYCACDLGPASCTAPDTLPFMAPSMSAFGCQCLQHGYKAAPDCDKCVCPNGFAGDTCDELDDDNSDGCSKFKDNSRDIDISYHAVGDADVACMSSPGYDDKGYESGDKCTWRITSRNCHLHFWFIGEFDIYCRNSTTCDHWVEIGGFEEDVVMPGPRFCCGTRPETFPVVGFSGAGTHRETLLVTFRSPKKADGKFRGFRLCATPSC